MDVSIITINYKTVNLVKDCYETIKKHSKDFTYEFIIVDNSNDENEMIKLKQAFKDEQNVVIVDAKDNLGTSKANNLGAQNSSGEFLLFLNSDTLLLNNAIYEMLCTCKKNNNCLVGSNLLGKDKKPSHSFIPKKYDLKEFKKINSILFSLFNKIRHKRYDFNYSGSDLEISGYICSAALMLPRNLFFEIGMFYEDIFMYGDDPFLCYKAKYVYNAKMVICSKSKIIHLEGGSDDSVFSDFKAYHFVNGPFIYFCKAFGDDAGAKYLHISERIFKRRMIIFKILRRRNNYLNSEKLIDVTYKFKRNLINNLEEKLNENNL